MSSRVDEVVILRDGEDWKSWYVMVFDLVWDVDGVCIRMLGWYLDEWVWGL